MTDGRALPSGFWLIYEDRAFSLGLGVGLTDIPTEDGGGGGGASESFDVDAFDVDAFSEDAFDLG